MGIIHDLEGGGSFRTHLHNGDSLRNRTYRVPAGRPKFGSPPFTWEESAIDALQYEGFDSWPKTVWNDITSIAYAFEVYNGTGYRNKGINSPYLWSKTNHHRYGKYTYDGVYNPWATSSQVGAMAILKLGISKGYWQVGGDDTLLNSESYCRVFDKSGSVKIRFKPDPNSPYFTAPNGGRYRIVKKSENKKWYGIQIGTSNVEDQNRLNRLLGNASIAWVYESQLTCNEYKVNAGCRAFFYAR